ncbi:hypothetical protein NITGR_290036 [Nitrospina gracilis 3/211]|uniref:Uncharacterized protein n=1 Tax=Nitrospina gracilis (strain 3/211) TaxID=1266370 RepID=M1YY55_NITG3|nr:MULTISPECIES: baseplate J/gp47 family protein [Nitrospina]MCF8723382.1 peptidoglycan hydrolase-like protein with peptidoglycan-binding domain [Nitrospina sp. Nb-3]CCQ90437.1 hypothetical protein NITGR_290036 [Nitrospina gracilis 3/211]
MSERHDLTRWNRAGLSRFRYVDGNAITFLETLREQLWQRFRDPAGEKDQWPDLNRQTIPQEGQENEYRWDLLPRRQPIPENESSVDRQERTIRQYREQRPDYGWEVTRALARSVHVLTEHIDAYANEGYLQTATQWENVRRLVNLLNYHPAPPASAQTTLVLLAKEGKNGVVPAGFQVKNLPTETNPMVIFENAEALEIDSVLNAMKLKDWDVSIDTFRDLGTTGVARLSDRRADAVQGMGPAYYDELKQRAYPPAEFPEPDPNNEQYPLTLERLAQMEVDNDEIRFRELITKARMLTQFELDTEMWSALLTRTLLDLVNAKESDLAELSGQSKYAVAILQEELRRVQIALDEPVFAALTLSELGGAGLAAAEPVAVWIADKTQNVEAGQWALIVSNTQPFYAAVVRVDSIDETTRAVELQPVAHQKDWRDWVIAETVLHIRPKFRRAAWLNGPGVLRLGSGHGLSVDDVVAWEAGGEWRFARVLDADAQSVRLSGDLFPVEGEEVYHAVSIQRDGELRFPVGHRIALYIDTNKIYRPLQHILDTFNKSWADMLVESEEGDQYYELIFSWIDELFVVMDSASPAGTVQNVSAGEFVFNGNGEGFEIGDWLIGEYEGSGGGPRFYPVQVLQKEDAAGHFTLRLTPAHHSGLTFPAQAPLRAVRGPFRGVILPTGYGPNPNPVSGATIRLDARTADSFPELLIKGRRVMLKMERDENQSPVVHAATILKVDPVLYELTLDPPVDGASGFTVGRTEVHGNVGVWSHGETKPERVLGSGNATVTHQQFELKVTDVTFVPDATHPFGVRADVEVKVGNQSWQQQATLTASHPEDPHYSVRTTEDGHLLIGFGDGIKGRRLPTGTNNVRVRFRQGTGSNGNQAAGSVVKPVKPHPALKQVQQPQAASGGNERESIESLRSNAPSSVLTLERAVSETDFSHLAMRHSSVWQARAWFRTTGYRRQETVEVVVVPANGIRSPQVERDIAEFIKSHTLPGVRIELRHFEPVLFPLTVTLRVKTDQFDKDQVMKSVRNALEQALTLKQRRLGEPLYRSAVFQIVEAVEGVENSTVEMGEPVYAEDATSTVRQVARAADGSIRVIRPALNQVLHMEGTSTLLTLRVEDYLA